MGVWGWSPWCGIGKEVFKCQRSIPMNFFDEYKGQVVYNPN